MIRALAAIFVGSFLLFMIQPMLGRTLLPIYGGTSAVWTTCLAAYQLLLLAGYFYAHCFGKLSARTRMRWHVSLLAISFLWTLGFMFCRGAISAWLGWSQLPSMEVLLAVFVLIGLPYVLLGSGSSLVQRVVAESAGRQAYKLYAVSNLASFLGLFFYPFVLEPYVSLSVQWGLFSGALAVYGVLMAIVLRGEDGAKSHCVKGSTGEEVSQTQTTNQTDNQASSPFWWFVLPGISCFTLNAVTAHITLDVMPLPLLWAVILGLFLLSYVVGFSKLGERTVWLWAGIAVITGGIVATIGKSGGTMAQFAWAGGMCLFFFFAACLFLHSWLYTMRPGARHLTLYYLGNAVGGAVGGTLASVVAPLVFNRIMEYPIALMIVPVVVGLWVVQQLQRKAWRYAILLPLAIVAVGLAGQRALSVKEMDGEAGDVVMSYARDFFGTARVFERQAKAGDRKGVVHEFIHGTTVHGAQAFLPGMERNPTTYFMPNAIGYAIAGHPNYRQGKPMRVGVLGLGIGVLYAYSRPGDTYVGYEISPVVVKIATDPKFFTFVSGSPATTELRLEDARKGLEAEVAKQEPLYDVLIVDAFTGDNLPYHLSTVEAFELYFSRLAPDGILAVNISNWHMELEPFMKALGDHFGVPMLGFYTAQNLGAMAFSTTSTFFCRKPEGMGPIPPGAQLINYPRVPRMAHLPTDEKGSFVSLIRWL